MIKFSKKEKEIVHRLHLLTGKPFNEVKDFYEGLLLNFVISYLDKEPVSIPLFGEIYFHYHGDEITSKGRKAKIDIDFTPSDLLIRVIGQIEDGEESDLEKALKEKNRIAIENPVSEDE